MSWGQLKGILDENKEIAQEEAEVPISKCPDCAFVPLRENEKGEKLCPICGWSSK